MKVSQTKLWKEIKEELHEDVSRFDVSSLDDLESWSENALDCPSNTLSELLDQIPEDKSELYYDLIDEEISKIVKSVKKELDENGEDEEDEE